MMRTLPAPVLLSALLLAGCGTNGPTLPSLTTGSIFSPAAQQPGGPAPITAVDRAIHTASITARATKCGYNFDPAQVRQDYLAYESSIGGAAEAVAKASEAFDRTNGLITKAIAKDEAYCNANQTKQIKTDLTKVLSGDFSPPQKKQANQISWMDTGLEGRETINWEGVFDPSSNQDKTKRVIDE